MIIWLLGSIRALSLIGVYVWLFQRGERNLFGYQPIDIFSLLKDALFPVSLYFLLATIIPARSFYLLGKNNSGNPVMFSFGQRVFTYTRPKGKWPEFVSYNLV